MENRPTLQFQEVYQDKVLTKLVRNESCCSNAACSFSNLARVSRSFFCFSVNSFRLGIIVVVVDSETVLKSITSTLLFVVDAICDLGGDEMGVDVVALAVVVLVVVGASVLVVGFVVVVVGAWVVVVVVDAAVVIA